MKAVKAWIEAMRLRTLPVSVAGVFCAFAFAHLDGSAQWLPGWLCLLFAVLAQISSNFANEYYDFKAGLDKAGRVGPRRGVTEGDLSARAMRNATFGVLALACAVGCSLIYWGGYWLIALGLMIAIGVLAYSAGPYPLSRHGLGEAAVIMIFGIIPVNMTYYLMCGRWSTDVAIASLSMGLLGANVLIVNNYRDVNDDREVGKITLCVKWGRKAMSVIYLVNGLVAIVMMAEVWNAASDAKIIGIVGFFLYLQICLYVRLVRNDGAKLNRLLGATAGIMLLFALTFLFVSIFKITNL